MKATKSRLAGVLLLAAVLAAAALAQTTPVSRVEQINRLIRENNLGEAETLAQQWIDVEPIPYAWYTLGTVLFAEKKYIEAYSSLQRALQGPSLEVNALAKIHEMLGYIDWQFKHYDRALTWLKDGTLLPGIPPETRQRLDDMHRKVLNEKGFTTWLRRDTPAIVFFYPPGPDTLAAIPGVMQDYSAIAEKFIQEFQVPATPKIQFYYYGNEDFFHQIYPEQAHSFIYLTEQGIHGFPEWRLKHEFYHLLIYRIRNGNYPSFFISEGFAEYLRRRDAGESVHDGAAAMLATRGLPPFSQIDQLDVYENDVPWAWDLVASFTGFLVERHGMDKYLQFWKSAKGLSTDCPAIYGTSFEALYRQWTEALRARPLPAEVRWQPFEEELMTPGLYADALAELERHPPTDSLGHFQLARVLTRLGRFPEALAAIRPLIDGANTPVDFTPATRGAALLLAGQLLDLAGERATALTCYQNVVALADAPAAARDAATLGLKIPCRPVDFPPAAAPDSVRRAEHWTRYRIRTGLSSADLLAAVTNKLAPDKLIRLFRDLDTPLQPRARWLKEVTHYPRSLERPEKFLPAWDEYSSGPVDLNPAREVLRQDLAGFVPERCLDKIRAAGISIVDIGECLELGRQAD
jgi:tetratricopeptide (TPR) repeat protein